MPLLEMPLTAVAIPYMVYIAFQGIAGTYLVFRAIKTRMVALSFLGIALLSMVADVFISDFGLGTREVKIFTMMNYPVFYVLFTRHAFYSDPRGPFKAVLASVVVLRVIHAIEFGIFGLSFPPLQPCPQTRHGNTGCT